ncbi:MAG: sugar phosphate nucleotidyltransferase [bacterium]|nr:sugar phosphate nucleotidyltransferase [bacterium]
MDRVAALILAGGRGGDFGPLSEHRTKAAFPVAGHYRVIDFVLSNLSHSGIRQLDIIIQYLPASLMDHVSSGRPWDFDMADRHLRFMTPFVGIRETRWFHGTADAIAKNVNLIKQPGIEEVLILSGEHVYRMDYRQLLSHHRDRNADITFACVEIPPEAQHPRFGNVLAGEDGRIAAFIEKPLRPQGPLVSAGIYCFKRDVLLDLLATTAPDDPNEEFSLAKHVLEPFVDRLNAQSWLFRQPWYYLADLREYFHFHMDIAEGRCQLFDESWDVMTSFSDRNLGFRSPAFFHPEARVTNSLVSPGCRVGGAVNNSVLSPGVEVGRGSMVDHCVIFHDVKISEGAQLHYAVVDKDAVIEPGGRVGQAADSSGNHDHPIAVVPKGHRVGAEVGAA